MRSELARNGVTLDVRHTSFTQGLISGTGDQAFRYGGKADAFINFDSTKMGLWQGGGFYTHFEFRHGPAPANLGGAIFAANTALFWPTNTPDELVATSLNVRQRLGGNVSIAVGKFNPVDLLAGDSFYGGWGIDRFWNLILAAPPSGLIPVVFMGGVLNVKTKPVALTLLVFDPDDRTNDYFPGDLFADGVNISLSAAHVTKLAGRKTTFQMTGLTSTAEGVDYSAIAPGLETMPKSGAYNISFEFRHNLQESVEHPGAAWGFNLKMAVADGNPNYVQSSFIAGIGGNPLFLGRPQDSFGVAVYRYNLSDALQDSLSGFTQFRDEAAFEAFYDFAVAPWLRIGADIQYIKPAFGSFDDAVVAGMRAQVRF